MYFYFAKADPFNDSVSDSFIFVNNFGYVENYPNMLTDRKNGRFDYQLIYVKSGSLTIHGQDGKHILSSGDICLFRPNEPQIYSSVEEVTYYWIHFTGSEVERMLSFFKECSYHVGVFTEFEQFCSMTWSDFQDDQESAELFLDGTLITIIARISKLVKKNGQKANELSKLNPALQIMKAEWNIRRTNEELSLICGLNKHYFIRLFKKNTGTTPQEYYAKLIIDNASNLLQKTSHNISKISKLCGIDDALYFSRMFKKHMGVSPFEYRKNRSFY